MYRPKPVLPIRIPKLEGLPIYEDLRLMLERMQQNGGRKVELVWEQPEKGEYMLIGTSPAEGGDPDFVLQLGTGPRDPQVWNYATGDIGFILNLILGECAGVDLTNSIDNQQWYAAPAKRLGLDFTDGTQSGEMPVGLGTEVKTDGPKATLEGDLANMQAPGLLQSIGFNKLTGRLTTRNQRDAVEIFFEEGVPIHAVSVESKGDLAVSELLTWETGQFQFFPDERTMERTIKKRLDSLMMEGITLLDQSKFLSKQGLKLESYLIKKHPQLTEQEFEAYIAKGAPIDLSFQKKFWAQIDNASTLFEILRRRPLVKTDWVPIVFNLLSCDLVIISERPAHVQKQVVVEALEIDRSAIESAQQFLVRPETGLMQYSMFLYLLEKELFRCKQFGIPCSIILIDMLMRFPTGYEALPNPAVREASRRLLSIMRPIDVCAHYETFSYGVLLPHTDTQAASLVANQALEILLNTAIGGGLDSANLAVAMGVSSFPEDAQDIGMLLAAAIMAKENAKASRQPIMLFRGLRG